MSIYLNARNGMTNHDEIDVQAPFNAIAKAASGVINVNDLKVVPNSGMSIQVGTGSALFYSTTLSSLFHVYSDATANITISSNATGSTRIDLICLKFDTGVTPNANASNVCSILTVEGTAGAGVPSTPAEHFVLAKVTVASGASSIGSGEITDMRPNATLNANVDIVGNKLENNIMPITLSTGTSTAYVLTPTNALSAYTAGLQINVKFHVACGVTPTINVSGLGAKTIKRLDGGSLVANDIAINSINKCIYDGTDFRIVGVSPAATYSTLTTLTDGATVTIDHSLSTKFGLAIGGNRTLAFSNLTEGKPLLLDILQDATGSRTVTWPATSSATATMTIAAPCVVTSTKDIGTTTPVVFTTSGALPTGLLAGTRYYWIRLSSTTGNLATSVANAIAGTTITTTGSQSGTHTMDVQIRWANSDSIPTLTTSKYRRDTIGLLPIDTTNGIVQGQVVTTNW